MNPFGIFIFQIFCCTLCCLGLRPHHSTDIFYQVQKPVVQFLTRKKVPDAATKDEKDQILSSVSQAKNKAEEIKSEIKQDEKQVEKMEKAMQQEPTPSDKDLESMAPLAKLEEAVAESNVQQDLVSQSVSSVNNADTNAKMVEKSSNEKDEQEGTVLVKEDDAKSESLVDRAKRIGMTAVSSLDNK